MLVYQIESENSAYGQLLIKTRNYKENDRLISEIRISPTIIFPTPRQSVEIYSRPRRRLEIEATFKGPEAGVLRRLANEAKAIIAADPDALMIKDDWRRPVPVVQPISILKIRASA